MTNKIAFKQLVVNETNHGKWAFAPRPYSIRFGSNSIAWFVFKASISISISFSFAFTIWFIMLLNAHLLRIFSQCVKAVSASSSCGLDASKMSAQCVSCERLSVLIFLPKQNKCFRCEVRSSSSNVGAHVQKLFAIAIFIWLIWEKARGSLWTLVDHSGRLWTITDCYGSERTVMADGALTSSKLYQELSLKQSDNVVGRIVQPCNENAAWCLLPSAVSVPSSTFKRTNSSTEQWMTLACMQTISMRLYMSSYLTAMILSSMK